MFASILKFLVGLLSLANRLIPSWEFQAGKKAALLEQAAIKDRLDAVYDKIDSKYLSVDDALSSLSLRTKNYYGEVSNTKSSAAAGSSMSERSD